MTADTSALISAIAAAISAAGSAGTLWLLARQLKDARRFGAAPAIYALLKEFDELMSSVRRIDDQSSDDPESKQALIHLLEFFERIEHLRLAGVLPLSVLRRAFGPALSLQLADPRVIQIIREEGEALYSEVFSLAEQIAPANRPKPNWVTTA